MRRTCLMAALLAAACAEAPSPQPVAARPPAAARPAPVPVGTPEQQASSRLNRALNQDAQADRFQGADPNAPRQSGEPGASPFDVGGSGQGPVMPDQVSPAFRGL